MLEVTSDGEGEGGQPERRRRSWSSLVIIAPGGGQQLVFFFLFFFGTAAATGLSFLFGASFCLPFSADPSGYFLKSHHLAGRDGSSDPKSMSFERNIL